MKNRQAVAQRAIDWAVAWRASPGEADCGDAHLVEPTAEGMLLGVVDGLGHGREAAAAAGTAIVTLKKHADQSLRSLFQQCHTALMKTRGVVMTLVLIHPFEMRLTWLGVGNVAATLFRAAPQPMPDGRQLLLRNGVVGHQLPQLQSSNIQVARGDLLVLATDGIGHGFVKDVAPSNPPQRIADGILSRHFQGNDDALVLVARFVGYSP